jgi:hypothetical protein
MFYRWRLFMLRPLCVQLVSYSAVETPPTVRVWNTGISGFFSSLLGIQGRCTQVFVLDTISPPVSLGQLIRKTKLTWKSADTVRIVREDLSQYDFTLNA